MSVVAWILTLLKEFAHVAPVVGELVVGVATGELVVGVATGELVVGVATGELETGAD